MTVFEIAERSNLKWVAEKPLAFGLREGETILATLEWDDAVGHRARSRMADQIWNLERISAYWPSARVSVADLGPEIAYCGRNTDEGPCLVNFQDGAQFMWGPLATIECMTFGTPDGSAIVDFRPYTHSQRGANITVHKVVPALPVLLVLGWYILEMEYREQFGLSLVEQLAPSQSDPSTEIQRRFGL